MEGKTQQHRRLSAAERKQRRDALNKATQVRRGQRDDTGGIERDLAALREERS